MWCAPVPVCYSVLAVLGPSGAGKTTFCSALADKAPYGKRIGKVFINGVERSLSEYVGACGGGAVCVRDCRDACLWRRIETHGNVGTTPCPVLCAHYRYSTRVGFVPQEGAPSRSSPVTPLRSRLIALRHPTWHACMRADIMLRTQTVEETLKHCAATRLPPSWSDAKRVSSSPRHAL